MTIFAAGGTATILVTTQAVPVISGFEPGLVNMVLVAIAGLALQVCRGERISFMAGMRLYKWY